MNIGIELDNYRPIALLPAINKIIEKLQRNFIIFLTHSKFLVRNNLASRKRKELMMPLNKSTILLQLRLIKEIDLQKAFDTLDCKIYPKN